MRLLEYELFENADVGVVSFLHDITVNFLLEHGRIDVEIANLARELRNDALRLLAKEQKRLASHVRIEPEWANLMRRADQIRKLKVCFDKKSSRK